MQRELIGYKISGQDSGTVFIPNKSHLARCPTCGARYDFVAHNPDYHAGRKQRSDISYTYDGVPIVTKRFREFIERNGYKGVRLLPFKNDLDHFHLVVNPVVPYDQTVPELDQSEFCEVCKRYNSVATGTNAVYLTVDGSLNDGFYRTDLFFGHGDNKGALTIVGPETRENMERFGLKGILFSWPAFGTG